METCSARSCRGDVRREPRRQRRRRARARRGARLARRTAPSPARPTPPRLPRLAARRCRRCVAPRSARASSARAARLRRPRPRPRRRARRPRRARDAHHRARRLDGGDRRRLAFVAAAGAAFGLARRPTRVVVAPFVAIVALDVARARAAGLLSADAWSAVRALRGRVDHHELRARRPRGRRCAPPRPDPDGQERRRAHRRLSI